jgi:hypothetical protein
MNYMMSANQLSHQFENGEPIFPQFAKHFEISEDLEDEDSIEMMYLSPKKLTHILLSKVFRRQMHHFNGILIFHIFENTKVFCMVFCVLSYKKISFSKLWKCWL